MNRKTLKQEDNEAEARDGMDIAFCKINHNKNELQYSGAHRPLYLLRNGELQEFKGDRKAIGGIPHRKKAEKDFGKDEVSEIRNMLQRLARRRSRFSDQGCRQATVPRARNR